MPVIKHDSDDAYNSRYNQDPDDDNGGLNPNRYYCQKCGRITRGYPIGCWEKDCPIKGPAFWDFVFSGRMIGLILIGGLFILGMLGLI